jgi:Flp pilus assembly protein TadD
MLRCSLGMILMLALSGCGPLKLTDAGSLGYRQRMADQRARAQAVPESEQTPAPTTVEGWVDSGSVAAANGKGARALWHYLEAHRLDPQHPEPLIRLGYFHLSQDAEKSVTFFARAIELAPDSARAHTGVGLARLSQGRYDEAAVALERAVEIAPGFATAQDALGVVYAAQDDPRAGRSRSQLARNLDPRDARILNNYGVSLLTSQEWSEAEKIFRSAILLDSSQPSYYNNLGVALGRQRRYPEAETAFERFGTQQAVQNNLGYLHYLNGEKEDAIACYELALRESGDDRVTILRNLKAVTELAATGR